MLLCFIIAGVMIFNVVHSLGELAVMYPVSGKSKPTSRGLLQNNRNAHMAAKVVSIPTPSASLILLGGLPWAGTT